MTLRGPPSESVGTTATIFHGLRVISIMGALVESRPSLYSNEEWKQVPPTQLTEVGLLHHRIFAILADCTRLIGQRDRLSTSDTFLEDFQTLETDVQITSAELESLRSSLEALNRSQMAEVKNLSAKARELGVANHVSATAYMLYNTAYIFVL